MAVVQYLGPGSILFLGGSCIVDTMDMAYSNGGPFLPLELGFMILLLSCPVGTTFRSVIIICTLRLWQPVDVMLKISALEAVEYMRT